MLNYRKDDRSHEEFVADIKSATRRERELLDSWLLTLDRPPDQIIDFGCGNSGEYLKHKNVTSSPDFELNWLYKMDSSSTKSYVEVKFSKQKLNKYFHLKVAQVKNYIKYKDCYLLMVNGSETKSPKFTVINNRWLEVISMLEVVKWKGFGNKSSYRIPILMFDWGTLPNGTQ